MNNEKIHELVSNIPSLPGVYLMKGKKDEIVYIGKARNLKARVRQYFLPSSSDTRYFAQNITALICDIEIILTRTEKEAVLLEFNLIQKHLPKYNIRLTDGKKFFQIRLDANAKWPRIELVRKPARDKANYFGPYPTASSAREVFRLINRHFKLRKCKDSIMKNRTRPCLQYQIKRCLAPCVLDVDKEIYMQQVQFVKLFLEGRKDNLVQELKKQMAHLAQNLKYEEAATLRDQISAVEDALATQRVTHLGQKDQDIIGFFREGDLIAICVIQVLSGHLIGTGNYFFKQQEFPDEEILSSFIIQYYNKTHKYPDEIIKATKLEDDAILSELLSENKGSKVKITTPKKGIKNEQLEIANINARQFFADQSKKQDDLQGRLEAIKKTLKMDILPRKIECIDIAHMGGTNTVGAFGVVMDGKVNPALGRTYILKKNHNANDYSAMEETLTRRFIRAKEEQKGWQPPDLLVVDGGKGQLSIALDVLKNLGFTRQVVVALAKERAHKTDLLTDRIYLPLRINPINIKVENSALFLLSAARDEAHRLANKLLASIRKKTITSDLAKIEGIGPSTQKALLKKLGSYKKVKEATLEELQTVCGIGKKTAQKIYSALHPEA